MISPSGIVGCFRTIPWTLPVSRIRHFSISGTADKLELLRFVVLPWGSVKGLFGLYSIIVTGADKKEDCRGRGDCARKEELRSVSGELLLKEDTRLGRKRQLKANSMAERPDFDTDAMFSQSMVVGFSPTKTIQNSFAADQVEPLHGRLSASNGSELSLVSYNCLLEGRGMHLLAVGMVIRMCQGNIGAG
jgi:hypothetical protein